MPTKQLVSSRFLSTSRKSGKDGFKKYLEVLSVLVSASGDQREPLSESGFYIFKMTIFDIFLKFLKMSRNRSESLLEPPAIEKSSKNHAEWQSQFIYWFRIGAKHSSLPAQIQKSYISNTRCSQHLWIWFQAGFWAHPGNLVRMVEQANLALSTVLVAALGDHKTVLSKSGFCFSRWDFFTFSEFFSKMSRIIQESSLEPPAIEKSTKNDAEC